MWAKLRQQMWQWRGVLIAAPSVTGLLIGLRVAGWLQGLELAALDQFFRLRPKEPVDSRIVIVEINETDVQKAGQWPMSDATLAKLLETLKQQQPRAIGLDIYRDLPVEPGHRELVKVFESTPNLIGIQKVVGNSSGFLVNPSQSLSKLGQVAANDFVVDTDGKIRRSLLSLKRDKSEKTIVSLGAALALKYLEAEGITLQVHDASKNQLKLGKTVFTQFDANDGGYVRADAGGYQILSNFHNLRQGFRTFSMTDVLQGRMPADLARGRIVLIGVTAESVADFFYTPYSTYSRGRVGQSTISVAGVEVHADLTSQILSAALDGRPQIRVWSEPLEWLWIFGWSVVGAALSWTQRYRGGVTKRSPFTVVSIFLAGGSLISGSYVAFLQGWWIPVVPPVLALLGSAIAISSYVAHMATGMRQTFGRYLTDEVVASLLETPEGLQLGGEKRKVTILMSDLRGFSALSERVPPEIAVDVINFYLEVMTEVISQYNGTINEIMGDGIFVMFGAPITREDDSQRAIACAIAMQLAMDRVNQHNQQLNQPPLEMGIGINTGEVLMGNIGSKKRAKYTVLGSPVNLAARIESFTVGGQILVSKDTLTDAGSIVRVDEKMQVQPKGFQEPITVYEIGGIGGKFNLFVPKVEEMLVVLNQEIPVQYAVLKGKHLGEKVFQGKIIKLSAHKAEIHSEYSVELLSNLKINLLAGTERARGLGDIYAKVVEISVNSPTNFCVCFTGIPPEVAALLYYLCQSSV
ncbi:MAG TPA: adenylate/guanylate cyclase domain-containing protein [Coleofasciculaceae cyanobacterium]